MRSLTALLILLILVSFVVLGPGIAPMAAATAAPVTVQFVNPGKSTDFQVRGRDANYTASRPVLDARNATVMTTAHPVRVSFDFLLTDASGNLQTDPRLFVTLS
jgi:hypothetical protein